MLKINDKFILGALAGIFGNVILNILNYLSYYSGLTEFHTWQIAASPFIPIHKINSPFGIIIGLVADFTVAITLSLVVLILLNLAGKDFALAKGIFVGLLFWVILFSILFNSNIVKLIPRKPDSSIIYMISHGLLGAICAWFITKFGGDLF